MALVAWYLIQTNTSCHMIVFSIRSRILNLFSSWPRIPNSVIQTFTILIDLVPAGGVAGHLCLVRRGLQHHLLHPEAQQQAEAAPRGGDCGLWRYQTRGGRLPRGGLQEADHWGRQHWVKENIKEEKSGFGLKSKFPRFQLKLILPSKILSIQETTEAIYSLYFLVSIRRKLLTFHNH